MGGCARNAHEPQTLIPAGSLRIAASHPAPSSRSPCRTANNSSQTQCSKAGQHFVRNWVLLTLCSVLGHTLAIPWVDSLMWLNRTVSFFFFPQPNEGDETHCWSVPRSLHLSQPGDLAFSLGAEEKSSLLPYALRYPRFQRSEQWNSGGSTDLPPAPSPQLLLEDASY